jgi:hypothetical protein
MPVASDAQAVTAAAEQAASAGDYAAAEQHLRRAVELQEVSAGPTDPDLANTLNNLAVVCERLGKATDAEHYYRRAHAIASAVLAADHPFVALSEKNLRDFCEARDIPFERSAPAVPVPAAVRTPDVEPLFSPPVPTGSTRAFGRLAAIATGLLLLIIAALVVARTFSTRPSARDAGPVSPPASAPAAPETAPPTPTPAPEASAPSPGAAPPSTTSPAAEPLSRSAETRRVESAIAPTVISAELCRTLETRTGDWQCTPVRGSLQPGTVFFYTRVASPTEATIEHRWYRNERLHQAITLRVHANVRSGYRTFSRMTVRADRTGDWRVELRTAQGSILHEERFTVGP